MKILYITHRVPYPPDRGSKIRPFNMLRHLSTDHSISLVCLAESEDEIARSRGLENFCASVHTILLTPFWSNIRSLLGLFSPRPLTLPHFYSRKLKKIVEKAMSRENFDLIFVHSSSMAQYALNHKGVTKIIDIVDADSEKWKQYSKCRRFPLSAVYFSESLRLTGYEQTIIREFDRSIVNSETEKDILQSRTDGTSISVIPNGVDSEYFKPRSANYQPDTLVFLGKMDYFPNVDAVLYFHRHIFPLIRREVPDVKFLIVGVKPTKEVQRLQQNENVTVTGYVPDVRPYLEQAAVFVAPLRIARGIQNKVLEAMAMGIPVVATKGAYGGIDAVPERDLIVEDEAEMFAAKVVELLQNPHLRQQISLNARRCVKEKHDWNTLLAKLDGLLPKNRL